MKKSNKEIKDKLRKSFSNNIDKKIKNYIIDSSFIINKFVPKLLKKGARGNIIIPNAVMAELESMANKGREEGFIGLEEVAKLHKLKKIYNFKVEFMGERPNEHQIKFAKSGEIDSLIISLAKKEKACLATADLVQAMSAKAYDIEVILFKVKEKIEKRKSIFSRWRRKKR